MSDASQSQAMVRLLLFWSPRVVALVFAAFLSAFAFAAFGEGHGTRESLVHFAASMPPALIVVATLAIAWRRGRLGAALFLGLAVLYIGTSWGRFPFSTYLVIAGPPIVVAALFLVDWKYGRKAR